MERERKIERERDRESDRETHREHPKDLREVYSIKQGGHVAILQEHAACMSLSPGLGLGSFPPNFYF